MASPIRSGELSSISSTASLPIPIPSKGEKPRTTRTVRAFTPFQDDISKYIPKGAMFPMFSVSGESSSHLFKPITPKQVPTPAPVRYSPFTQPFLPLDDSVTTPAIGSMKKSSMAAHRALRQQSAPSPTMLQENNPPRQPSVKTKDEGKVNASKQQQQQGYIETQFDMEF